MSILPSFGFVVIDALCVLFMPQVTFHPCHLCHIPLMCILFMPYTTHVHTLYATCHFPSIDWFSFLNTLYGESIAVTHREQFKSGKQPYFFTFLKQAPAWHVHRHATYTRFPLYMHGIPKPEKEHQPPCLKVTNYQSIYLKTLTSYFIKRRTSGASTGLKG